MARSTTRRAGSPPHTFLRARRRSRCAPRTPSAAAPPRPARSWCTPSTPRLSHPSPSALRLLVSARPSMSPPLARTPMAAVVEIDLDLDGDGTYEVNSAGGNAVETASFASPGCTYAAGAGHRRRRRGCGGDRQVDVTAGNQPPQLTIGARADGLLNDNPCVEGPSGRDQRAGPATSTARSCAIEFDLDGDGTYETDRGTSSSVVTTFGGGPHEVGVRATDNDGVTSTSRRSLEIFVGELYGWPTLLPGLQRGRDDRRAGRPGRRALHRLGALHDHLGSSMTTASSTMRRRSRR